VPDLEEGMGANSQTPHIRTHQLICHKFYFNILSRQEQVDRLFDKLLLKNVTCEPTTFSMWLQQMCFELAVEGKRVQTVSTWVRLCTSV